MVSYEQRLLDIDTYCERHYLSNVSTFEDKNIHPIKILQNCTVFLMCPSIISHTCIKMSISVSCLVLFFILCGGILFPVETAKLSGYFITQYSSQCPGTIEYKYRCYYAHLDARSAIKRTLYCPINSCLNAFLSIVSPYILCICVSIKKSHCFFTLSYCKY